jgi:hypothetical protein
MGHYGVGTGLAAIGRQLGAAGRSSQLGSGEPGVANDAGWPWRAHGTIQYVHRRATTKGRAIAMQ